jgi:hypothetical protein
MGTELVAAAQAAKFRRANSTYVGQGADDMDTDKGDRRIGNALEEEQLPVEQWLAIRKEAGLKIDPATAELSWGWGYILDPYGVYDLSDEERCAGRTYFARAPGSDIWVEFRDLPDATRKAMWARKNAGDFDDDDMSWLFDD